MRVRTIAAIAIAVAALLSSVVPATATAEPSRSGFRLATSAELSAQSALGAGTIQSDSFFQCLDVYDFGRGPWVQAWGCNGFANQQFYIVGYTDGTWEVRSSADNWCVDAPYGRGASLEHRPCTGVWSQRFHIWVQESTGLFAFESAQFRGQVWDVYDFGRGTEVMLWDWDLTGRPNQEWF